MNNLDKTIIGVKHIDSRGILIYVNDFDMSDVKRLYMICPADVFAKRGWRGHKLEQRWFFVTQGEFEIKLAKIDNWENPDQDLELETYVLSAEDPKVLHIPIGYATGFKSLKEDSKMMVYADSEIGNAKFDDHQYHVDYFNNWKD